MSKRDNNNYEEEFNVIKRELYDIYDILMKEDKISLENSLVFTDKLNDIEMSLSECNIDVNEKLKKLFEGIIRFSVNTITVLIVGLAGVNFAPELLAVWILTTFFTATFGTLGILSNIKAMKYYQNDFQNKYYEERVKLENTISNCRLFLKKKSTSHEEINTKEVDIADTFIRVNEMLVTFGKNLDTSVLTEEEINILTIILQENLGASETELNKLLQAYDKKILSENLEKDVELRLFLKKNDKK